jgi:hypothetical protein
MRTILASITILTSITAIAIFIPAVAQAQDSPPPILTNEPLTNYCIYANKLYSMGAELCVEGSDAGMRCSPPNKERPFDEVGGRAFWSNSGTTWSMPSKCGLNRSAR